MRAERCPGNSKYGKALGIIAMLLVVMRDENRFAAEHQSFYAAFDCFCSLRKRLVQRLSGAETSGNIGHGDAVIAVRVFMNDDGVSHGLLRLLHLHRTNLVLRDLGHRIEGGIGEEVGGGFSEMEGGEDQAGFHAVGDLGFG